MAAPGPPPAVPHGWQVTWSDQYNQWFYSNPTTGASQWDHPAYAAQPAPPPQPPNYAPPQQQYSQQGFAPPPTSTQPDAPAKTGIMGAFGNLDPRAQTALTVGGGLAAGALLEHELVGRPHHGGHHHLLGGMAGLMGAAGAGALGAKFFGGMGKQGQAAPPPVSPGYPVQQPGAPGYPIASGVPGYPTAPGAPGYPTAPGVPGYPIASGVPGYPTTAGVPGYSTAPGAPTYPGATSPPPVNPGQPVPPGAPNSSSGMGGLEKLAVGGAAGVAGALATEEASHLLHHQSRASTGAANTATGSGHMSSIFGDLTNSGPGLNILAAVYADKDITNAVRSKVSADQSLSVEISNEEFGDPWPEEERKGFSVLYHYGNRPLEVWAASTDAKRCEIKEEALANSRMAFINKNPGRIISLVWGQENVLNKERAEKLETEGELDCANLGGGGYAHWQRKSLTCYYRGSNGGVGIAVARENGTVRLPWNPLAQWT